MHYPLIDHTEIIQPVPRHSSVCAIISYLCIASCITTLTYSDLIIAYSSSPCYQTNAPFHPFPVQLWIAISGYMGAILLVSYMFYHARETTNYQRCIILLNDTLLLLMFMWNILGTVILCIHYYDYLNCSISLVIYLIIRLSIGLLINFFQLYMDYQRTP